MKIIDFSTIIANKMNVALILKENGFNDLAKAEVLATQGIADSLFNSYAITCDDYYAFNILIACAREKIDTFG